MMWFSSHLHTGLESNIHTVSLLRSSSCSCSILPSPPVLSILWEGMLTNGSWIEQGRRPNAGSSQRDGRLLVWRTHLPLTALVWRVPLPLTAQRRRRLVWRVPLPLTAQRSWQGLLTASPFCSKRSGAKPVREWSRDGICAAGASISAGISSTERCTEDTSHCERNLQQIINNPQIRNKNIMG